MGVQGNIRSRQYGDHMNRAYTLACQAFRIEVELDDSSRIVSASIRGRKFVGGPVGDLKAWMQKFGGFKMTPATSSLFDAVEVADTTGKDRP